MNPVEVTMEWCRIRRPDLVPILQETMSNAKHANLSRAYELIIGISFQAGRCFQSVNPECPLGLIPPNFETKPITAESVYS